MSKDLTFYNRKERPWLNRLDRGAVVGHTDAKSSRLWVRLKGAGTFRMFISTVPLAGRTAEIPALKNGEWEVSLDGIPTVLRLAGEFSVEGGTDFTHVVDVDGLLPDTVYHYGVVNADTDEWELGMESNHRFRTFPDANPGGWDIAFGLYSCHMPYDPKYPSRADASMWGLFHDELIFANARFVIGGGDQVYVDGTGYLNIWKWLKKVKKHRPTREDMVSWYRDIYRGYWGFPDLKKVHRSFPNYMIWDDHEIMDGWGSYTKKELSQTLDTLLEWEDVDKNVKLANKMFKAAKQVYNEYQHSHNPRTAQGVYDYEYEACGADFFVLDMRGKRNFDRKEHSILGAAQLKRFRKWAENQQEKDTPLFVVSSVPVVHLKDFVSDLLDWASVFGARDDVRDHWAHKSHKEEITAVLDALFECADRTGRPLVILSGDVHIGGIFSLHGKGDAYPNAKVYQVTSSAISYAAVGPMKMKLLAKTVARSGEIGAGDGGKGLGYSFRNYAVFPQHNFGLVRYRSDGSSVTHLEVDLIGKADERPGVKESTRFDLLRLDMHSV